MRHLYLFGALTLCGGAAIAQYSDLGTATRPLLDESIETIPYHGEAFDMSGGYQIGDTVANFTVYDELGNRLELYSLLEGPKPVVVVNGSVSCPRFADIFRTSVTSDEFTYARDFINGHAGAFRWVFLYGMEAHPNEGDCPSNCPPMVTTDTLVVQATNYGERVSAVASWNAADDLDFPFQMYADNPDNAVYNAFFERPSGLVAINCDGVVAQREDWLVFMLNDEARTNQLLEWGASHQPCTIEWEGTTNPVNVAESPSQDRLKAWPNPYPQNGPLHLNLPSDVVAVRLLNMTGSLVDELKVWSSQSDWDLPSLPSGCYFIETLSAAGNRSVSRLLVE